MPTIPNQLHASLRGLWRRPVHSLVAVSILALGLSTAVAVFGYLDGFHQPFPGVEARQLVRVFGIASEEPYQDVPHLDFLDYASDASSWEGLAATQPFDAASVRREALPRWRSWRRCRAATSRCWTPRP